MPRDLEPQLSFLDPVRPAKLTNRLFVGVWPDAAANQEMTSVMRSLQADPALSGRLTTPDRRHATTHHLGDFPGQIPSRLLEEACAGLATIRHAPFEMDFDRLIGVKGLLLLRPSDGAPAFSAFRRSLSAALILAGVRFKDERTFSPHATLSYNFSELPERAIEPIRWRVREVLLVESLLGKHQHIVRKRWPLLG